ncbi:DUF106 domain-containing protein [Haloterrigena salifodinae]|uniref:DUF106 domain-containing protein n=2 Tax=Haloterrigena salifodinae TaxID=2675099 RepID=A0A8T8E6G9_9EURY|nr:DUF106 domain-containing protein [Haloterrigena salifodinae]
MPTEQLEMLLTDPSMQEAISVILERSNDGREELEWSDVSDALSSAQWGRLIEQEVLVSAGAGFTVAEPEGVRARLETDDRRPSSNRETIEPYRWSALDKAAGATAVALFAGYWSPQLRDVVASTESVVLGPITEIIPFYGIIVLLSIATGLYSTVLQSRLTDHEKIQQYTQRMEALQNRKQAAEERGDDEALKQIRQEQREAAGDQLGLLKVKFRPMVWTMLVTIPVFLWLRWKVNGGHLGAGQTGLVVPLAGHVTWQQSLVGPMSTWIVWYFLCSMASRQIIQKTLGVQR